VRGVLLRKAEGKEFPIMEELRPEELEELVQELEREPEEEEALSPEVDALLPVLQSGAHYLAREAAADLLGNVETSSTRIVRALTEALETDPHPEVRATAAESLRASVHQQYLRHHPEMVHSMERALAQVPGREKAGQATSLVRCLKVSSVAGLAVGFVMALIDAEQLLFHDGGLACGTGFLVAFVAGAFVGAIVGGLVQGRDDLVSGSIAGAASAGVAAAVSWLPITVFRIVQLGGP